MTFTPNGDGYTVAVNGLSWEDSRGRQPPHTSYVTGNISFAEVGLPFSFPLRRGSVEPCLCEHERPHLLFAAGAGEPSAARPLVERNDAFTCGGR